MGRKMVMVAALLATSVMEVTMTQAMVTVAMTGRSPRGVSRVATQDDRPDTFRWGRENTHSRSVRYRIIKCEINTCLYQQTAS